MIKIIFTKSNEHSFFKNIHTHTHKKNLQKLFFEFKFKLKCAFGKTFAQKVTQNNMALLEKSIILNLKYKSKTFTQERKRERKMDGKQNFPTNCSCSSSCFSPSNNVQF